MLLAGLILFQRRTVLVVADEREMEPFAPLDGIGHRRTTDNEPVVFHARKLFELLELSDESGFVFFGHVLPELEEHFATPHALAAVRGNGA